MHMQTNLRSNDNTRWTVSVITGYNLLFIIILPLSEYYDLTWYPVYLQNIGPRKLQEKSDLIWIGFSFPVKSLNFFNKNRNIKVWTFSEKYCFGWIWIRIFFLNLTPVYLTICWFFFYKYEKVINKKLTISLLWSSRVLISRSARLSL